MHLNNLQIAFGERACFVKHKNITLKQAFECFCALDDDSAFARAANRCLERHGQASLSTHE